ncbi:MAG: acyl-CoA dehydrogenase family protein [Alphaproteobacteria bacterium]
MSDHIDWPFFTDAHRATARSAQAFADEVLRPAEAAGGHEDAGATVRRYARLLAKAGLLGHAVPAPFGGLSERLDSRSICLCREALATATGLGEYTFAMQGLGSGPISLFGSAEMKRAVLPRVAAGEAIAAFALSEPEAGSDVAALAATAHRDGGAYVLNGAKTWISNAGIADFYTVFVRTGEAPGARGLSAFLVDAQTPGFRVDETFDLIAPHPIGRLVFEDCRIPADRLIGVSGEGFKVAMATLDVFRASVGAAALGFARRALADAVAHCDSRQLFGGKLSDLQMTQGRLADMAVDVDASALLVYRAAWAYDRGGARATREASTAKLFATEAAQRVIDASQQLHGGHGVVSGNPLERLYREIRAMRIYEGATEVQKLIVARELLRAHRESR